MYLSQFTNNYRCLLDDTVTNSIFVPRENSNKPAYKSILISPLCPNEEIWIFADPKGAQQRFLLDCAYLLADQSLLSVNVQWCICRLHSSVGYTHLFFIYYFLFFLSEICPKKTYSGDGGRHIVFKPDPVGVGVTVLCAQYFIDQMKDFCQTCKDLFLRHD